MPRSLFRPTRAAVALLALVAACEGGATNASDESGDVPGDVADALAQVGDSVAATEGTDVATGYYAAADLLRAVGFAPITSPISVSIDGVVTPMIAAAIELRTTFPDCPSIGGASVTPCAPPGMNGRRVLTAWTTTEPRRLLVLSALGDSTSVLDVVTGRRDSGRSVLPASRMPAMLDFRDGRAWYTAAGGTQRSRVTTSTTACPVATVAGRRDTASGRPVLNPPACVLADFSWSLDARVGAPPLPVAGNPASGTKRLVLTATRVAGTQVTYTPNIGRPDTARPNPAGLRAAVSASGTRDSVVLVLKVVNGSAADVDVAFPSGQRFDFQVLERPSGRVVWTWSADKMFTAALAQQRIAARETLAFSTVWKPSAPGDYVVRGVFTSSSHPLRAEAALSIR